MHNEFPTCQTNISHTQTGSAGWISKKLASGCQTNIPCISKKCQVGVAGYRNAANWYILWNKPHWFMQQIC